MLNADTIEVLTTSFNSLGDKNLFNYCDNNPVLRDDEEGELWGTIGTIACKALLGGVVSAGIEISAQLLNNGGDIKDVDFKKVGMSFLSGTVSGAVAAIPLLGKFTVDVVMGGFSNLAGDLAVGETKNLSDVGKSFGKGMASTIFVSGASTMVKRASLNKFKKLNRSGKKSFLQNKVYKNKGKSRNINLKRYAGSVKFDSYISRNSNIFMRGCGFAFNLSMRMWG